jgi:putative flippase GtrA
MAKKDIFFALLIGEIVSWLVLVILKNLELEINKYLPGAKIESFYWLVPIILPVLAGLGLWLAWLVGKKVLFIWQGAKFILVGILNTFIDLGILNFLIWISGYSAGWFFALFKSLSFSLATFNSYLWNKFWTFEKKTKIEGREFGKFYLATAIGFLLNVGGASFLVNIIGPQFGLTSKLWANASALVGVLLGAIWNFSSYKFLIFKK